MVRRSDLPGRRNRVRRSTALTGVLMGSLASFTTQAREMTSVQDLKLLSFDDLLNVQVTSVSRKEEQWRDAAAAIAVISQEDIRRSGATTLPETLRAVPGLHVAQTTSSTWAISSRGFSSVNSEKLLVLADSRSIYTPLYSGVFWDVQGYLLEDVDRIEVIRGPGATQWGSNAVNGVINIQTKSARDTQGAYAEAAMGDELRGFAGARYGGTIAEDGYYRFYAQYADHDGTFNRAAQSEDEWHMTRFGMRADWDITSRDTLTVQGDIYEGKVGQLAPSIEVIGRAGPSGDLEVDLRGGHVLSRWRRTFTPDSNLQLRVYYDRTRREDPSYDDSLDTVDIDLQHEIEGATRHHVVWGVNYRYAANDNEGKGIFALDPHDSEDEIFSAFVQDEISLRDTLHLTLGSKFEHNDFSGFEVQPSVRAAWRISSAHTAWAAVSRAARVPTRIERDIAVDVTDPAGNPVVRLLGNEDFDAERLLAYEVGYRWHVLDDLFVDTAGFYNDYEDLATLELGTPFVDSSGRAVIPIENQNRMDGQARGVETQVTYSPMSSWRLIASYAYVDLELQPHGLDLNRGRFLQGATPKHQFGLRSLLDLSPDWQLDMHWRSLSDIESLPAIVDGSGIDGYTELDVRLAWRGWEPLDVSLVGRNLLHRRHVEFGTPQARGAIERSVYGKVSWRF